MRNSLSLKPFNFINNINIKSKFMILGGVILVPMMLFMWMNIHRVSQELTYSAHEIEGVDFIAPVRQVIQNAQAHRGMSNAFLSGKYSLKVKIDAAEQRADMAMAAIEKVDQQYGVKFQTQNRWQSIKRDWASIKQQWAKAKASPQSVNAPDSFKKHTALINDLLDYVLYLSDQSGLTTDPEVSSYYLINIVYFRTLNVIENMGKIRGLGAGVAARQTATPVEVKKLSIMSSEVARLLKGYEHDMGVLKSVQQDAQIKPAMDRLQTSIDKLNRMVAAELLETEIITVDSAHFFEEASKSIKLSYDTFDKLTGLLKTTLIARHGDQQMSLTGIYGLTIISLGIVSLLLISVARDVVVKSSQIKARMYDLAKGRFGNERVKINHTQDELGEAMQSAETLEDNIKRLLKAMNYVSKQQEAGDIDCEIDVSLFRGGYADMAEGVNKMVADHVDMNKKVLECAQKFGEGDLTAELAPFPGKKAIANRAIEQIRQNINALIEDSSLLAQAVQDGKLDTRADAKRHLGGFRKIIEGINEAMDAVTRPLNTAARYIDSIANGKIPEKITEEYRGDFSTLQVNLNLCIDAINALISDANKLASATEQGELSIRADADRHSGDFRKIMLGMNNTMDSVVVPLN